jgi:GT2 family glycosyltransferase
MQICAVIVNYFGAHDTIACARQLCLQPVKRICVVDNSSDATESARLAGAFAGQETITLFETGKNGGFAAGVNYALRRVKLPDFDAVLVLNNDTSITDGFIETLAGAAQAHGLDIAGPRIHYYPDTKKLWSRGHWYNAWCALVTQRPLPLPGNVFYLTGCCLLIQCSVFHRLGLFNESFFMYGEDVDFCFRASRAGLKTGVVDEALLLHKTNASSRNNSFFYERQVARSHLRLSQSLFKTGYAQALAIRVKIPFLFMRALWRTFRFGNLNALKGLLHALGQDAPDSKNTGE